MITNKKYNKLFVFVAKAEFRKLQWLQFVMSFFSIRNSFPISDAEDNAFHSIKMIKIDTPNAARNFSKSHKKIDEISHLNHNQTFDCKLFRKRIQFKIFTFVISKHRIA